MTKAFAIALLKQDIQNSKQKISYYHNEVGIEALEMAIKALEQTELNSSYNSIKSKLEPCEDCISRAEALHACCDEWNKDYKAIMKSIRQLPSVTPQQKVGKWIWEIDETPSTPVSPAELEYAGWVCSCCHQFPDEICEWDNPDEPPVYKYCPNCGARMEVDE